MVKSKELVMHEGKIKDIKAEFSLISWVVGAVSGVIAYHYILKPTFNLPALTSIKNTNRALTQENTILRTELNKTAGKLAQLSESRSIPFEQNPQKTNRERAFGFAGNLTPNTDYGFSDVRLTPPVSGDIINGMPFVNPSAIERQRKFGAMENMNFAQNPKDGAVANAVFNML